MSIADVIREGRELHSLYESAEEEGLDSTANDYWNQLCSFYAEHGPTLLAVAEAAVEMRENAGATLQLEDRSGYHARRAPRLLGDVQRFFMAFDAAARGKRT